MAKYNLHHEAGGFVKRGLWVIVLIIALIGCAKHRQAYLGLQRPAEDVAIIKTGIEFYFLVGAIENNVFKVDGKDFKDQWRYFWDLEVLPGKHTLSVEDFVKNCDKFGGCEKIHRGTGYVNFIAEAGHAYHLESELEDGKLYFWLEDAETGEVVSEEKPPGYKPKLSNTN